jgi:thiol-disulfide isomerase/thioredoxin
MFKKNYITLFIISWMISLATVYAYDDINKKTLLIFSADWCKSCQIAKNDINNDPKLSETIKEYEVIILDYDLDKDAVSGYNIKNIPTFVILSDNKETKRKVGYKGGSEALNKFLK